MATFASLTPQQQAVVENWQTLQAAWCEAQAKANDLGQQVDAAYNEEVSPLSLGSTEIIPITNGLAGAESMVYSNCVTIESHIQGIATTYNTIIVRELWLLACGPGNL